MNGPAGLLRVEVDIEAVVLRGVPRRQALAVLEALQGRLDELAGVAAAPLAPWSSTDVPRSSAPPTRPADPSAAALGRAVAESVWAQVAGSGP